MGACQGESKRVEGDEKGPNTKPQVASTPYEQEDRESEG